MTRLTDTSVRALKPSARQYFVRDETLRGFGVRGSPGGTKTFALMHGAERRLTTIGRCGVITLQDARIAAKKMLAEETLGNHAPQTVTFCEALKLYISTHLPHNRTAYESERVLKKHLLSPLQSKKLTNIHYQHVAVIVDRIKTNSAANHLYVEARTFFNWAVKRHYLTVSPLAGSTPPHPFVSRDRVLTHEELRVLWRAAENIGYPYGTIVQLLFWGQRRGETAAIRSDWITNDLISFPPEFVKNGRRHDFPIGPLHPASLPRYRTWGLCSFQPEAIRIGRSPVGAWDFLNLNDCPACENSFYTTFVGRSPPSLLHWASQFTSLKSYSITRAASSAAWPPFTIASRMQRKCGKPFCSGRNI